MPSTPASPTVEKLFRRDAYLTRTDTCIVQVDGDRVRLAATNFFAFSGGQESDGGTIGGYAVAKAEKDGLDIVCTLARITRSGPATTSRWRSTGRAAMR